MAATIEQANELVERAACDAALLDLNLGGHSVVALAASLARRSIPFAFVTGYGREALPSGFAGAAMVKKPVGQSELIAAVEQLCEQTPALGPSPASLEPAALSDVSR